MTKVEYETKIFELHTKLNAAIDYIEVLKQAYDDLYASSMKQANKDIAIFKTLNDLINKQG